MNFSFCNVIAYLHLLSRASPSWQGWALAGQRMMAEKQKGRRARQCMAEKQKRRQTRLWAGQYIAEKQGCKVVQGSTWLKNKWEGVA